MQLSNSFTIDRPSREVFAAFLDIERVASCMPGSRVTAHPGPDIYEGEVKVKVGPLGVAYTGKFTILEADHDQLRLTMRAKGRELHGAGNADAHITAQLSEERGRTLVAIETELGVRGKVAQFGRGVIGEVTDAIMQTFAHNVEQLLVSGGPSTPTSDLSASSSDAHQQPPVSPQATSSPAAGGDLDVWRMVLRPMVLRHRNEISIVVASAVAAYLGARLGARRADRRGTN